jgi:hypothetical protein
VPSRSTIRPSGPLAQPFAREAIFAKRNASDFQSDPLLKPYASQLRYLAALEPEVENALQAFRQSLKSDENAGHTSMSAETRRLADEARRLTAAHSAGVDELQRAVGIPEEVLKQLEKAQLPFYECKYLLADVLDTAPTDNLDVASARGLEALLQLVDPRWLKAEGEKEFRLDQRYRAQPLHLVSGVRFPEPQDSPQRFAEMLLVANDYLSGRPDFDFFNAPMFLSEVAALGTRLDAVRELGPEAIKKLQRLPEMTENEVSATVYELLVGSACAKKGLHLEMLPTEGRRKTPDYRIHNLPLPSVIECKRRLSLLEYEVAEGAHIRRLFSAIRPMLSERRANIGATFTAEISTVDASSFAESLEPLLASGDEALRTDFAWGYLSVERLPYVQDIPPTRLFSPDFLDRVFGWKPDEGEWDGISCEVDVPDASSVSRVRNPRCMKWVSLSPTAMLKKARGITSLWGRATKQVPAGDLGFVYVAYSESNRSAVADARTQEILAATQKWNPRWTIQVPVTMVDRLYPRSLGPGLPDLIESVIPCFGKDDEHYLSSFPACVFMRPARSRNRLSTG